MSLTRPSISTRAGVDYGLIGAIASIMISLLACVLFAGAFAATSAAWWNSIWCFVALYGVALAAALVGRSLRKTPKAFPLFVIATSLAGTFLAPMLTLAIFA
jgi:hypothetical protein